MVRVRGRGVACGAVGKLERDLRTLLCAGWAGDDANHFAVAHTGGGNLGGFHYEAGLLQSGPGLAFGLALQAVDKRRYRTGVVGAVIVRHRALLGRGNARSHRVEGCRRLFAAKEIAASALAHGAGAQRTRGGPVIVDIRCGSDGRVEAQESRGLVGLRGTGLGGGLTAEAGSACRVGSGALFGIGRHVVFQGLGYFLAHCALARRVFEVDLVAVGVRDFLDGVRLAPHALRGHRRTHIGQLQRVHCCGAECEGTQVGFLDVVGDGSLAVVAAGFLIRTQAELDGDVDQALDAQLLGELDERGIGGVGQRVLHSHRGGIAAGVFHAVLVGRAVSSAAVS